MLGSMLTRRCSFCRKKIPAAGAVVGSLKAFCNMEHLIQFARTKGKIVVDKAKRLEKKADSIKLKRRVEWVKEAQAAFNSYIRERDRGNECISCSTILPMEDIVGGGYDCGHYRSTGSSPHLRFNLHNAHGQCKKCNRYLSGSVTNYRIKLVKKIGNYRLDALEANQVIRKYSIEYLQRIKLIFTKKVKRIKSNADKRNQK